MYHHVWKDSDSTNNKEALHSTNLRHILRLFHYKTNHSLKVNGILAIHRCSSSWRPGQHSGYQIWQHLNVKTHGDLLPQPSRQSTAFRWKEPHSVLPQGDVALKKGRFWKSQKKLFGWIMLLGFSFHVQKCLSCCCNKFQEFQDVCSCVSTLWSAYASTYLSQQIGAKRFEA